MKLQPKPTQTTAQQLVHFVKHFWEHPIKNSVAVLILLGLIAVLVVILVVGLRQERERERVRRESLSYVVQTQALDNVKSSLNSLLDFVEAQKGKLQESEDIVTNLQAEQEKLKPVVETNRQIIDAILDLQAQKTRSDVWKERAIGIATGVLGSFLVALLFWLFERKRSAPPTDAG